MKPKIEDMRTDDLVALYGEYMGKYGAMDITAQIDKSQEAFVTAEKIRYEIVTRLRHYPELLVWKNCNCGKLNCPDCGGSGTK